MFAGGVKKRQPTRVADKQSFPNNDFQLKCHFWCVLYFIMGNRKRGIRNYWRCNGGIKHNEVKGLGLPRGSDEHLKLCTYICIHICIYIDCCSRRDSRLVSPVHCYEFKIVRTKIRLTLMKIRRYSLYYNMLGTHQR